MKISDLGQAKFRPPDVQYLTTKAPGCIPYMPPECLVDRPHFTEKSDIFSFGVVILQVATQQPPSCGLVNISSKSEVDRREGDLAVLSDAHPLKPVVFKCLKDDAAERPSCDTCLALELTSAQPWSESLYVMVFGIYSLHNERSCVSPSHSPKHAPLLLMHALIGFM